MTIQSHFKNYRRFFRVLALVLSLYSIGMTFACFAAIRYFLHGDVWMFQGPVLASVLGGILVFALFSYTTFLVLDGKLHLGKTAGSVRPDLREVAGRGH